MPISPAEEEFQLLDESGAASDDHIPVYHAYKRPNGSFVSWVKSVLLPVAPSRDRRFRGHFRGKLFLLKYLIYAIGFLIIANFIFRPSYTNPPAHYKDLQKRVAASDKPGRGNPDGERVFISVSLYDRDGALAGGAWGRRLLELIDLLGPENTYLSIYENDSGDAGRGALLDFEKKVPCDKSIVYEEVDKDKFQTITMPGGEERLKRLTYLTEMRNRALRQLDQKGSTTFDKVLIFNDAIFNPTDILQLLFSTNQGPDGKADYLVACGMDFHSDPLKYYDVYATRDLDGYSMGIPYYPFFSSAGTARSRQDMQAQKDAVRVKSCWGGVVVFDAKYLQSTSPEAPPETHRLNYNDIDPEHPVPVTAPARFRAEPEVFFDACECCLIIADVIQLAKGTTDVGDDSGVYINPYVRVAYSERLLSWIPFAIRFERIFAWPQGLINALASMPTYNPYREVVQGQEFEEETWQNAASLPGGGFWERHPRRARNGLYCGVREMQLLRKTPRTKEKNWENTAIPSGGVLF